MNVGKWEFQTWALISKYEHDNNSTILNANPNAPDPISRLLGRLNYSSLSNLLHTLRGIGPGARLNDS